MGDLAGQWFKPFALTIACSVLVSLFVSFSLDPMLSAYWPDPRHRRWRSARSSRAASTRSTTGSIARRSATSASSAGRCDHRFSMVLLAIASFVGALALPALGIVGGGFLPDSDDSEFLINIETPPGSNLDYTQAEVGGSGASGARHARGRSTPTRRSAAAPSRSTRRSSTCGSSRRRQRERQPIVEARLRAQLVRLGGVTASIGSGNFENQKQIQLQLRGPELARAEPPGAAAARRRCSRCRAPSTSACRRAARSRSSTSRSTAAWPAASA